MNLSDHQYLGDGVYASFDGYQIWLHLDRHDSPPLIALDSSTFCTLLDYARERYPEINPDIPGEDN